MTHRSLSTRRHLLAAVIGLVLAGALGCTRDKPRPGDSSHETGGGIPAGGDSTDHPAIMGGAAAPDEHDEAAPHEHPASATSEAAGSITISAEGKANIGLKTATVDTRTIERTLLLNGTLKVDPDRDALVSSRVAGKVISISANVGDAVALGQSLVSLQSLQIAETPPTVQVVSPLDGVVLDRSVTVGQTIDPSVRLFRVADLTHLLAQAEVHEADLAKVRRGQLARIRVLPFPDQVYSGRVVRLADAIDPERRTLLVWIEVQNTPDRRLKPEMFAQVDLVVARLSSAVVVPNEAVQMNGPERFVFVQNGESFVRQNVVVGERDDRYTAILSGLVPGDEVVTVGAVELRTLSSQPSGAGLVDESKPHTH